MPLRQHCSTVIVMVRHIVVWLLFRLHNGRPYWLANLYKPPLRAAKPVQDIPEFYPGSNLYPYNLFENLCPSLSLLVNFQTYLPKQNP